MHAGTALAAGYTEGLRPSERERSALLRAMEKDKNFEKRRFPRTMLEGKFSILIVLEYLGGSAGYFRVYPWDLSRGGLGFFHRAFVHPGTKCTINGNTTDHQPISLKGEVVRCEHVAGTVHTVGIKFEMEIDPEIFLGEGAFGTPVPPPPQTAQPSGPAAADVPPPPLSQTPAVQTGDPWWDTLANLCVELNQIVNARTGREQVSEKLMELMAAAQAPASPAPAPAPAPSPTPHAEAPAQA
jgi:hypothetical protein